MYTDNLLHQSRQIYMDLLSTPISLDTHSTTNMEEEDNTNSNFSIPLNLVSEEKMGTKFIENCKALIRSSIEYKQWVKWFKLQYNPIVCSVSDNTQTIEVHHHPFVLEDYVDIAISFIYNSGMMYSAPIVADLVLRWHYMDIVGACYMSKTYHMRFHENHDIDIPEDCIRGNLSGFITNNIIRMSLNSYLIDKLANYCPIFYNQNQNLLNGVD